MLKGIFIFGSFIILCLSVIYYLVFITERFFYDKPFVSKEDSDKHFISDNKNFFLLNSEGALQKEGWLSTPLVNLNYQNIKPSTSYFPPLNFMRYKKWNAISFSSDNYIGLVAGFDLGYGTGILFHIANIKNPEERPFSLQEFYLKVLSPIEINDQCVNNCSLIKYRKKSSSSSFEELDLFINNGVIDFKMSYIGKDIKVAMNLKLSHEVTPIVTLNPISKDSTLFYYNEKYYCLKPMKQSLVEINSKQIPIGSFYFGHDSGRGVWPLKSGWFWLTANGITTDGKLFGFNSGNGFINPKAKFTEDSFFIDGKMFKISYIKSETNKPKGELRDYTFNNDNSQTEAKNENRCNIQFTAKIINKNIVDLNLPLLDYSFEVIYGVFSGYCIDENKNKYVIKEAYGIGETKNSIW